MGKTYRDYTAISSKFSEFKDVKVQNAIFLSTGSMYVNDPQENTQNNIQATTDGDGNEQLNVTKDLYIMEGLYIVTSLDENPTLYFQKDVQVNQITLTDTGMNIISDNVIISNNLHSDFLVVANNTTLKNATINNDLIVANNTTLNNATINNDLIVANNTTLNNDLIVANNTTLNNDLIVANNTTLNKELSVANDVTFSSYLNIGNVAQELQNAFGKHKLQIEGNIFIQGDHIRICSSTEFEGLIGHSSIYFSESVGGKVSLMDLARISYDGSDQKGDENCIKFDFNPLDTVWDENNYYTYFKVKRNGHVVIANIAMEAEINSLDSGTLYKDSNNFVKIKP